MVGIKKYGVTTAQANLTYRQWLRHLQEELLDASVYIEALLNKDDAPVAYQAAAYGSDNWSETNKDIYDQAVANDGWVSCGGVGDIRMQVRALYAQPQPLLDAASPVSIPDEGIDDIGIDAIIEAVAGNEFWHDATPKDIERVRKRAREAIAKLKALASMR